MKRMLLCLLAVATLFVWTGCTRQNTQEDERVVFYYQRAQIAYGSTEGVIAAEHREPQENWTELTGALNAYVDGPRTTELANVFPENCDVLVFTVSRNVAEVHMSRSFAQLQGMDLTLACVCMTKTVMALTDVKTVRISAEDSLLAGEQYLELNAKSVLYFDDSKVLGG